MVLVAKEVEQANESSERRKRKIDEQQSEPSQPQKKQCTLPNNTVPATRLQNLFSNYVIEEMMPLSTVEAPAFLKLIGGICSSPLPGKKSLHFIWMICMMKWCRESRRHWRKLTIFTLQ